MTMRIATQSSWGPDVRSLERRGNCLRSPAAAPGCMALRMVSSLPTAAMSGNLVQVCRLRAGRRIPPADHRDDLVAVKVAMYRAVRTYRAARHPGGLALSWERSASWSRN